MFLDGLLPSQDTIFKFACNALQPNSFFTRIITWKIQILENNQSSWQQITELDQGFWQKSTEYNWEGWFAPRNLPIYLLIILTVLIGLTVSIVISKFILRPCFPNLKYRKAGLIGIAFSGIAMLVFFLSIILVHQGFKPQLLFVHSFVFTFLLLGIAFQHFSRYVRSSSGKINFIVSSVFIFIVSNILVFIAAHVFPQQIYRSCTAHSLSFIFMIVFSVGFSLAFISFCVFNFQLILNSEKLYFSYSVKGKKYKGHIVKKGSEWVEVLPDEVFNV